METDPLEAARAELKSLRDADDWDEPTGRTDVHVHIEKPDSEKPPKSVAGAIRWGLGALGAGAIVALVSALQQCGKG